MTTNSTTNGTPNTHKRWLPGFGWWYQCRCRSAQSHTLYLNDAQALLKEPDHPVDTQRLTDYVRRNVADHHYRCQFCALSRRRGTIILIFRNSLETSHFLYSWKKVLSRVVYLQEGCRFTVAKAFVNILWANLGLFTFFFVCWRISNYKKPYQ